MLDRYFQAVKQHHVVEAAVLALTIEESQSVVVRSVLQSLWELETELRLQINQIVANIAELAEFEEMLLRLVKKQYPETTAVKVSGDQIVLYNGAFVDDTLKAIDFIRGLGLLFP